jgi:hypothetical protein
MEGWDLEYLVKFNQTATWEATKNWIWLQANAEASAACTERKMSGYRTFNEENYVLTDW